MSTPIRFDKTTLQDPTAAMEHEWLETNGLGAYASSTILGCNTRKYHGLLVSPVPGTDQRFVFLSRLETSVKTESGQQLLSTNQYPGALFPKGYRNAVEFSLDGYPRTRYSIGDSQLDCSVLMRYEQPAVLLGFRLSGLKKSALLTLKPLLAFRDFNATAAENDYVNMVTKKTPAAVSLRPYEGLPEIYFSGSTKAHFAAGPDWYRKTEYLRELERGYDYTEDLFTPGSFSVDLQPEEDFVLQVSIGKPAEKAEMAYAAEIKRRDELRSRKTSHLWRGADHFIITGKRAGKPSIVAGFPWFGEWGRDAMIALPGLTLSRDKPEIALEILESYASFEQNGLFPNQLHAHGGSSYNTVDASLWFFWAAQMYARHTGKPEHLLKKILPTMKKILQSYAAGKVPFGAVREDGLLEVGSAETQLTWMDAKSKGQPVTPRYGRPVEINALWLNALSFYAELSNEDFTGGLLSLKNIRQTLADIFLQTFWMEDLGYLADVVYPDNVRDASIRPNQIFALSLPYSALSRDQAARVLDTVERHLLTPFGIRTLSPNHGRYAHKYQGDQESRDAAYHQGTVWPWPIGHFVTSYLAVFGDDTKRIQNLRRKLTPLFTEHITSGGLGSVSEVFDGDEPHIPGGCPMQAWSVAEVLRASLVLDFQQI